MNILPEHISSVFRDNGTAMLKVKELASEVTALMDTLDPVIESHTKVVCPSCTGVCCVNRHSYHDRHDSLYLFACEADMPAHRPGIDDASPCQFLSPRGCTMRRSLRPYRCTWFFCEPLLDHIRSIPAAEFRKFIHLLESLTRKREEMVQEFRRIVADLPLSEPGMKGSKL
jgi:hypothetical protein